MKKWFLLRKSADLHAIAERFGITEITARLLRNRGLVTFEEMDYYLNATLSDMHSPHLLSGVDLSCDIILDFISKNKRIRVIGDYDIDGVCATTILVKGLRAAALSVSSPGDTACEITYRLPDRIRDGYGLNENIIREANDDNIDLIITCDNGIAASDEIKLAKQLGMSVIVTDHHEIPYKENDGIKTYIIPDADAVINPHMENDKYPFKSICGGMVAYKLILALSERVKGIDTDELLDFAAFATVGDIMPLCDENRICVKYGLRSMKYTRNIGLSELINATEVKREYLNTHHIGYILGPCVNAAGRLESAEYAMQLFLTDDVDEAKRLSARLKKTNDKRKEMMDAKIKEAIELIETGSDGHDYSKDTVLVVYLNDCHESLAGLVAGRVRERFTKPAIVFTDALDGLKGSGRSIEEYNMFDELSKCNELFIKFGGHKIAAGLTIPKENFDELRRRLNENSTLTEDDLTEKYMIDIDMPVNYVTADLVNEIKRLEPYGQGNPAPVFAQKNLLITSKSLNPGKTKLTVGLKSGIHGNMPETKIYGVMFRDVEKAYDEMEGHNYITVAYAPDYNEHFGEVQVLIKDYKLE